MVVITSDPLNERDIIDYVSLPNAGAISLFLGK